MYEVIGSEMQIVNILLEPQVSVEVRLDISIEVFTKIGSYDSRLTRCRRGQ